MSHHPPTPFTPPASPGWGPAADAMYRAAQAVAHPGGPGLFADLIGELAKALEAATAFVAVFGDEARTSMRTLAAMLDGRRLANFDYVLAGSPCAQVVGRAFRYTAAGVAAEFRPGTIFAAKGMDSYAAYPLSDSRGQPLGLLVAMDRRPIAEPALAEALLRIFAGRIVAELERQAGERERAVADEALRLSAASYRAIFESAEVAIFIHDWDSGALLDVNPKACALYGYSHAELRALTVAEISSGVPPYTGEQALAYMKLARIGRCPPFEWHRRNKDGTLHWDEVRLKPVQIGGRPHILAFTREITEHKAALAAVQAREEQYRAIFDSSVDAMGLWNEDLRLVDVNRAFTRISGWTREDVIGQRLHERAGESEVVRRAALIRLALAGEEGRIEIRVPRKDGTRIEVETRYVPAAFGGERFALSIARDITERNRALSALQASEEQYRAIFDGSADAMVLWDRHLRVVDVNRVFTRLTGYTRDDVAGDGQVERLAAEDVSERAALIHNALDGHEGQIETRVRRRDGSHFDIELRYVPVRFGGEPFALAVGRDISARRAAEKERAELEAQLRQAQKMEAIGQLTGGIAHDFNNILTSVIGYLVLGQERAELLADATLVRQLGAAQLAAQRARELIAQMLAFARRQRGERTAVALAPLVRQSLRLLRSTLPSTVVVDAGAIAEDDHRQVLADAVQIEQVLFNLCINARDAIDGPGWIRVRLGESSGGWQCASCRARVSATQRWLAITVADSGAGIAADVAERMFEPFYSTKEVGRGSGMGLAMVHGIVHDHGGHIEVQTALGAGTTFRILLPPAEGTAMSVPDAVVMAAPRATLRGRVMVVDDETMVGDFMAERLTTWGLEVVTMRDASEAAVWLAQPAQVLDLLITDQTMPAWTGLELARHASQHRPGLPVLLYTGNADAVAQEELQRHGVQAMLRKPVDPDALRSLLQRWLTAASP